MTTLNLQKCGSFWMMHRVFLRQSTITVSCAFDVNNVDIRKRVKIFDQLRQLSNILLQ